MSTINNFPSLNKTQLEAVEHINGPLLVLAGAGSGKTKLLTSRIVNLIHNHNVNPGDILAVTFTNKAANVMKHRISHMLQEYNIANYDINPRWIGTFHSLSVKILRKHIHLIGFDNNFTIIDQDDQLRLIKRIVKSLEHEDVNLEKVNFKAIINQISLWKDKNIQVDNLDQIENKYNNFIHLCKLVYPIYQLELRKANGCDFGDLIIHVINLLANNPNLQQHYNDKFKYILVDEYQDTNMVQYLWLRLLTQGHNNICCVGDDDQSIYGFRGAEVENILRFEKDFDNAKIIKLQQNYRSTKHILNVASYLINHNNNRHKKTLFTDKSSGNKVNIIDSWDDKAEAHNICQEIQKLIKAGCEVNEIAILIRASFQSRSFEESLIANDISYKVIGGLKFYDRKEIKDVIAYLRIINSFNDNLALERIINVPKRGIGNATIKKIYNFNNSKIDNKQDFSLFSNICNFLTKNKVSSKINLALEELVNLIKEAKELEKTISLSDLARYIITNSGYEKMLKESKEYNSETRLENLTEFFSALDEFNNLTEFLEHVSLVNEMQDNDINNSVNIITLHSAKGLEFDTVFLAGWEEGLFPHQRSIDESGNKGLEEERRLAYVGITRAKKNLYITHCANRLMYNKWQVNSPSRFLQELPMQDINNYGTKLNHNKQQNNYKYQAKSNNNMIKFAINDDVIHKTLGNGTVKSLIGDVVEVNFNSGKSRFVTAKTLVKIS